MCLIFTRKYKDKKILQKESGEEVKTNKNIMYKNNEVKVKNNYNKNYNNIKNTSGVKNNFNKKYVNKKAKVLQKEPIKIIPLGGLEEIGKNMTLIEYGNDIVIIDCGLAFPDHDMLGIDIVIPDFSYVLENKSKVKGILLTHGHEDHIGGLTYLLKEVGNLPIYGAKLTLGLVEGKLKEFKLFGGAKLNLVQAGDVVKLGSITAEFIAVNHSIPDACGLAITTPSGTIVHTGDFKIDYTPINGDVINLSRFAELGESGVLALLSDSTNVERNGMTMSERTIGESFDVLFKRAHDRRMIIATFSSNIHRVQQIMDLAVSSGRKVAVSGRSMETVVTKAIELGYLSVPEKTIISIDEIKNYPDEKLIIITTGSQGEPMSALRRMSAGDHRKVFITKNDFIIISATPIPGNEKFVNRVINDLMKLGAQVIYEDMYDVHVSGHACQNELKLIINLVKPRYFIPVHGEYKHLKRHAEMAVSMGLNSKNVHIGKIGEVIEVTNEKMVVTGEVTAGNVMVDGLGVGDVGSVVLKDRKRLSEDGLMILVVAINRQDGSVVAGPDIVSRGFVYVKESEDLVNETKRIANNVLSKCTEKNIKDWNIIKLKLKEEIGEHLYSKIKRTPMILTIIQDVNI